MQVVQRPEQQYGVEGRVRLLQRAGVADRRRDAGDGGRDRDLLRHRIDDMYGIPTLGQRSRVHTGGAADVQHRCRCLGSSRVMMSQVRRNSSRSDPTRQPVQLAHSAVVRADFFADHPTIVPGNPVPVKRITASAGYKPNAVRT